MAFKEPFQRVLAGAQADQPWAYERLYRELSPAVCGYLRLRGASDPEDLTSEVFLGAFRGIRWERLHRVPGSTPGSTI